MHFIISVSKRDELSRLTAQATANSQRAHRNTRMASFKAKTSDKGEQENITFMFSCREQQLEGNNECSSREDGNLHA